MDYPTTQEDFTQSQDFDPSTTMANKRQRRGSKPYKNYGKSRTSKQNLPVAIRTRGTPSGYYEIPVRQLIKVYCNTSTGLWDTSQSTSAPVGGRGWRGFGMSFQLDNTYFNIGEGSTSATIISGVPGFGQLSSVFDLVKIADISVQMWWSNQQTEISQTAGVYGGYDLYCTEDPNNADPPSALDVVMQYQNVKRYIGTSDRTMTMKIKPHVRISAGSEDTDIGTAVTLGSVQPAGYMQTQKPAVTHLGYRGWLEIPTASTARLQQLNILVTQTRRYKMSR